MVRAGNEMNDKTIQKGNDTDGDIVVRNKIIVEGDYVGGDKHVENTIVVDNQEERDRRETHGIPLNKFKDRPLHYSNMLSGFHGRSDELRKLVKFCMEESDYKFCWWELLGEGGSGKTRLCMALEEEVSKLGDWVVMLRQPYDSGTEWYRNHNVPETNCLFIMDYAQRNHPDTLKWMSNYAVMDDSGILSVQIRILLVNRRTELYMRGELAKKSLAERGTNAENDKIERLKRRVYSEDAIRLKPLDRDNLGAVIADYKDGYLSYKCNQGIDSEYTAVDVDNVLAVLECWDKDKHRTAKDIKSFMRPLYAMILTQTVLDNGSDSILLWNRDMVFKQLVLREIDNLNSCIRSALDKYDSVLETIARRIWVMATMLGGLCYLDLPVLLENDWKLLDSSQQKNALLGISYLFGNEQFEGEHICNEATCAPLEPDLVGEYFVLEHLIYESGKEDAEKIVGKAWDCHRKEMCRFQDRALQDYHDMSKALYGLTRKHKWCIVYEKLSQSDCSKINEQDYSLDFAGISWLFLDQRIVNNRLQALLISKDILSSSSFAMTFPFSNRYENSDDFLGWDNSYLRRYLNGEFLDEAFTDEKDRRIVETNLLTSTTKEDSGLTIDRVFLLSIEDAKRYFADNAARIANYHERPSEWWLRSSGYMIAPSASYVKTDGSVDQTGRVVLDVIGVRPALWLNLGF
jgi:hypothetical protein